MTPTPPPPYHEDADYYGQDGYQLTRFYKTPGGSSVRLTAQRPPQGNFARANAAVYKPREDHWSGQLTYGAPHWYADTPDLDVAALTPQDVVDALGPVLDTLYTRVEPMFAEFDRADTPPAPTITGCRVTLDPKTFGKARDLMRELYPDNLRATTAPTDTDADTDTDPLLRGPDTPTGSRP